MNKRHNQRCRKCKEKFEMLLRSIYGEVHPNYKLTLGAHVGDYSGQPLFSNLADIYNQLTGYRGYQNIVRVRTLPRVDYFVPDPGMIVEFDESQHFTEPRRISLSQYPRNLKLGYDKSRYCDLCETLHTRSVKPPYRDEQRAWYDTLRDFAPVYLGLKPTIRIFSRDAQWCSKDPNNDKDVTTFKKMLEWNRK